MKLFFTALLGFALISGSGLFAAEKTDGCGLVSACKTIGNETAEVTAKIVDAAKEADVGGCKCGAGCKCGVKAGEDCKCGAKCACCSPLTE